MNSVHCKTNGRTKIISVMKRAEELLASQKDSSELVYTFILSLLFFYYCLFTHFCPCSARFKLICTPQLLHICVLFHSMLYLFLFIFFTSHSMIFISYFPTFYYPSSILFTVCCSVIKHTSRNTKIYVFNI